jgi:predicted  nucleic acid-binding Zn-ribbon protein
MGSLSDFIRSASSDSMLPFLQQALTDVVMEVLNERQVPTRTDFRELRDVVNKMRSSVTATTTAVKKMEAQLVAMEQRLAALETKKPRRAPAKKKK